VGSQVFRQLLQFVQARSAGAVGRLEAMLDVIVDQLALGVGDGVLHDVSKVALSLCDRHPDGRYGHDLALWIRGAFHLFLFAMAVSLVTGLLCGAIPAWQAFQGTNVAMGIQEICRRSDTGAVVAGGGEAEAGPRGRIMPVAELALRFYADASAATRSAATAL